MSNPQSNIDFVVNCALKIFSQCLKLGTKGYLVHVGYQETVPGVKVLLSMRTTSMFVGSTMNSLDAHGVWAPVEGGKLSKQAIIYYKLHCHC